MKPVITLFISLCILFHSFDVFRRQSLLGICDTRQLEQSPVIWSNVSGGPGGFSVADLHTGLHILQINHDEMHETRRKFIRK